MSVTTADVSAVWRASSPSDRAYAVGVPGIIDAVTQRGAARDQPDAQVSVNVAWPAQLGSGALSG